MVLDTSILLVPCKDKEPIPTQYRPTFSRSILGACAFEHKRDVAILPTTKRQKRECVQEMMDSVKVGIQSDTGTTISKAKCEENSLSQRAIKHFMGNRECITERYLG